MNNPEMQSQTIKLEKWKSQLDHVDKIVDSLNYPVDEGIKESVAALLINGFPTTGSCEGHISGEDEERHGLPFPWVDVGVSYPEDMDDQVSLESCTIQNHKLLKRFLILLEEFNKSREVDYEHMICFTAIGIYGAFRIQSLGAEMYVTYSKDEQKKNYKIFKKEFDDFTQFLKEKFFKS